MKVTLCIINLLLFFTPVHGQDYFVKKYPVDFASISAKGMDYDSDSNIVINHGRLISLDKSGDVNWHQLGWPGQIISFDSGFLNVSVGIDSYNVLGDSLKRWRYNYDSKNDIFDVDRFDNGDLLITAEYSTPPAFVTAQNTRYTIFRINSNFDTIWTRNIGDTISIQDNPLCTTYNNYSIIAGRSGKNVSVAVLDFQGDLVWEKSLNIIRMLGGPSSSNYITDIQFFQNAIYLTGLTSPGNDLFYMKIDVTGNVSFVKYINLPSIGTVTLKSSASQLFVLFEGGMKNYVMNISEDGDIISSKYFEFNNPSYMLGLIFENDKVGYSSFIETDTQTSQKSLILAKHNLEQNINCFEYDAKGLIDIVEAEFNIVSQSFWAESSSGYFEAPTFFPDSILQIQDTTLCETYLPPPPPIEGDAILTIYPNPSSGSFQFQLTNLLLEEDENIEVMLYDVNGKIVLNATYNSKTFIIDTNNLLAKGMYICNLKVKNQEIIRKIIDY